MICLLVPIIYAVIITIFHVIQRNKAGIMCLSLSCNTLLVASIIAILFYMWKNGGFLLINNLSFTDNIHLLFYTAAAGIYAFVNGLMMIFAVSKQ